VWNWLNQAGVVQNRDPNGTAAKQSGTTDLVDTSGSAPSREPKKPKPKAKKKRGRPKKSAKATAPKPPTGAPAEAISEVQESSQIEPVSMDAARLAIATRMVVEQWNVLRPYIPNASYDLAVEHDGVFSRVKCLLGSKQNGSVLIDVTDVESADPSREGTGRPIDAIGVYCPDQGDCFVYPSKVIRKRAKDQGRTAGVELPAMEKYGV